MPVQRLASRLENGIITTAAQLIDPVTHMDAPIHALENATSIAIGVSREYFGIRHTQRFPIGNKPLLVDAEQDIRWVPLF